MGLPARAGAPGGHVPAHAARRGRRPADEDDSRVRKAALAALAAMLSTGAVAAATPADGVQVDVSRARGTQSETAVVIDPTNDQILLAGSNDHRARSMRTYGSTDGGATWSSKPNPPLPRGYVAASDPVVGIDRTGRQYFGFIGIRGGEDELQLRYFVATRASAAAAWTRPSRGVSPVRGVLDDKPALTVDTSPTNPHVNPVYP